MALTHTPAPDLGKTCPDFSLPGVDGRSYSRDDFAGSKALLVMFICNHCPYVKAIEDRLIALGKHFADQPVGILGICSNDASRYEEDSFENTKKRWQEKNYSFPYLYDEDQSVAKAFGAVCTPDFFLFDKDMKLTYRGRLDDNWQKPDEVKREELKEAVQLLLEGKRPSPEQPASMGCSIKWKQ